MTAVPVMTLVHVEPEHFADKVRPGMHGTILNTPWKRVAMCSLVSDLYISGVGCSNDFGI